MKTEDLQRLVDLVRAAEDPMPQPPGDLLVRARAARRRRRRSMGAAAGAVAVVGVVALGVSTWVAPDQSVARPSVDRGELASHGGAVCPVVQPAPRDDDGYGLGSRDPANLLPTFLDSESAWVCRYDPVDAGRISEGGGMKTAWVRNGTPAMVDPELLPGLDRDLRELGVDSSGERDCPANLGPRWTLVTSYQGDLTAVTLDDYGCGEVRLSDDPFVTAPGDPQANGTVGGILTAPDGLLTKLQRLQSSDSNTPAADDADDELCPPGSLPGVTMGDVAQAQLHPSATLEDAVMRTAPTADLATATFVPLGASPGAPRFVTTDVGTFMVQQKTSAGWYAVPATLEGGCQSPAAAGASDR